MKKNISINISGIIFHIEEDGYESLKNYLESINTYFSTYEDSSEIVADIESRIAEIFLARLKNGSQVITAADVQSLMATMGSIEDFEAIEETHNPYSKSDYREDTAYSPGESAPVKKLYRDTKRKILGGVAAGIAHYFNIDPLWIRLILIILLFDLFISMSIGLIVLLGYIVCWIIIPPTDTIEEDKKAKKMFRNPDARVLGGVAGGLAAYFGVEATLIRLLFVISIFLGGAGIIIYFILWIITPEAKTITDKMQMQGEPVTLSNIETNIKKSLNVKEGEDENIFVKILLFPFRLLAIIFSGLGKALGPLLQFLVEALRIIFGIFLVFISIVMLFALLIAGGVMLGIFGGNNFLIFQEVPAELIRESLSPYAVTSAFVFLFIPLLSLALLGIAVIAKRIMVNSVIGWSLLAIWILSLIGISFTLPGIIGSYSSDGIHRVTKTYNLEDKTALLTLREAGLENYQGASLTLRGHGEPEYKLVQSFESRGSSRRDALNNAKMVDYNVVLNDSVFIFDSNLTFTEDATFRAQELEMTLYIPYNQPFKMKEEMKYIIRNTIYNSGHTVSQMEGNLWQFTESGLHCITCEEDLEEETGDNNNYRNFNFEGFSSLNFDGKFEIYVREGNDYKVVISGDDNVDRVDLRKNNNELSIDVNNDNEEDFIKINIEMPELVRLNLEGQSTADIKGFQSNALDIIIADEVRSEIQVQTKRISIQMTDASDLTLIGSTDFMQVDLQDNASLSATEFEAENAEINAEDSSEAYINVTNDLKSTSTPASIIRNKSDQGGLLWDKTNAVEEDYISSKTLLLYTISLARFGIKKANEDLHTLLQSDQ